MKYVNIDVISLTQAISNAGWDKSVSINDDGSLNWYNEAGHPTDETICEEIDKLVENWTHSQAVARLAEYRLADGREEVVEMQDSIIQSIDSYGMPVVDSDDQPVYEQIEVIVQTAIDPLEATISVNVLDESTGSFVTTEVTNPLIVADDLERAEAQLIVDNHTT